MWGGAEFAGPENDGPNLRAGKCYFHYYENSFTGALTQQYVFWAEKCDLSIAIKGRISHSGVVVKMLKCNWGKDSRVVSVSDFNARGSGFECRWRQRN